MESLESRQIESQSLANILVDWVWGSGAHGIKIPQRMLGVAQDGIVGPKTLAALNATDHREFFDMVKAERELFFNRIVTVRPSQKKFLKGWLRRLNSIEWQRLTLNNGKKIKFKEV